MKVTLFSTDYEIDEAKLSPAALRLARLYPQIPGPDGWMVTATSLLTNAELKANEELRMDAHLHAIGRPDLANREKNTSRQASRNNADERPPIRLWVADEVDNETAQDYYERFVREVREFGADPMTIR